MVTRNRKKSRRFTVSLSEEDYDRLLKLANAHRPPFTLQYLVDYGIQRLLDHENDPQLMMDLGNPVSRTSR